eukprot:TRINITY_DN500_c1_g1_i1.p1 TRINITY_DN500_c1_g1~~TRINITY_DN500_c1_g1_i1.p1  ORF type:complete len:406 (-),score=122.54 TRINITY_DN500_c1_g1_i1:24-1241(-)
MLQSLKAQVNKLSLVTEEKFNSVKTAIQTKINNEKSPTLSNQIMINDDDQAKTEDIMEGWMILEKTKKSEVPKSSSSSSSLSSSSNEERYEDDQDIGFFGLLTPSMMIKILQQVDSETLCQLSCASKGLLKYANDEILWETVYLKDFKKGRKADNILWYEQHLHGGYKSLYGTQYSLKLLNQALATIHPHHPVDWLCKPIVSVQNMLSEDIEKILIIGPRGAGRTTIVHRLLGKSIEEIASTQGYNIVHFQRKNFNIELWDMAAETDPKYEFWKTAAMGSKGFIYVVDATNPPQLEQARKDLHTILHLDAFSHIPFLVLVNKRDETEAMTVLKVLTSLELHTMRNPRGWFIKPCSAKEDETAIWEGMDWLCARLKDEQVGNMKAKITYSSSSSSSSTAPPSSNVL